MRASPKLKPVLWDALVVLAVLALAAGSFFLTWRGGAESGALTAVISVDGAETARIPLAGLERTERTVTGEGFTLHIVLTETEAWVETSDCPTQDCVHTGHISRPGQSVVCLPARVIVRLEGGTVQPDDVDVVLG